MCYSSLYPFEFKFVFVNSKKKKKKKIAGLIKAGEGHVTPIH